MLKNKDLKHLIENNIPYLNKWMVLDENKLSTIKNNQLYAGFSSQFNDRFDTQIRLNDASYECLNKTIKSTMIK